MSEWVDVGRVEAISTGKPVHIEIDGTGIAVFRLEQKFYAIEDVCTHDGGPLAEGELEGSVIQCPRHGARFDVKTGKALCFPAFEPVTVHRVEIRGQDVFVSLHDE